jgi:hypothetical protein
MDVEGSLTVDSTSIARSKEAAPSVAARGNALVTAPA